MKVVIKYDKKPPYLPIAVGTSRRELAEMLGINVNVVHSALSHKIGTYFEMDFEEEDEWYPDNDVGLWKWGKNGEVVHCE